LEDISDRLDEQAVGNVLRATSDDEETTDGEGDSASATDKSEDEEDDEDYESTGEDEEGDNEMTTELTPHSRWRLDGMPGYGVLPLLPEETRREIMEYAQHINNVPYRRAA
jgi:hypothetical protein